MVKQKKKKRLFKSWVYYLITIILIAGFIYTTYKFLSLYSNYDKTMNLIKDLQKDIPKDIPLKIDGEAKSAEEVYTRDFEKLNKINRDTVGWIEIENTSINYPIVQTNNNKYYLTHSFNKKSNVNGWVFMNTINDSNLNDQNTTIFAHDSLFKPLKKIYNSNEKQDLVVRMYQEDKVVDYQVFSLYVTASTDIHILEDKLSAKLITSIKDKSKYNYGVEVSKEDQILTLSTCYNEGAERVILHAKRI